MRAQQRGPLSLEQLRQMDGQSVLYKRTREWFVVALNHPDFGECIVNSDGYYLPLDVAANRGVWDSRKKER